MAKGPINSGGEIQTRLTVVTDVLPQLGYKIFDQKAEPIPTVIADHDSSGRVVIIPLADGTLVSTYWRLTARGQRKPNSTRRLINEINEQCTMITLIYPSEGEHVQIRAFQPGKPQSTGFKEFMQHWLNDLSVGTDKIAEEDSGFFGVR